MAALLFVTGGAGVVRADDEKEALKTRIAALETELGHLRKALDVERREGAERLAALRDASERELREQRAQSDLRAKALDTARRDALKRVEALRRATEEERNKRRAESDRRLAELQAGMDQAQEREERAKAEAAAAADRLDAAETSLVVLQRANRQMSFRLEAQQRERDRVIRALGKAARAEYARRKTTGLRLRLAGGVLEELEALPAPDASPNGASEALAAVVLKAAPAALREEFKTGDTDKGGRVELVDAWGHPIVYLLLGKTATAVNAKGEKIVVGVAQGGPRPGREGFLLVSLGPNGKRENYDQPDSDDLDASERR